MLHVAECVVYLNCLDIGGFWCFLFIVVAGFLFSDLFSSVIKGSLRRLI